MPVLELILPVSAGTLLGMPRSNPPLNGNALHQARIAKGWTQAQVSELTGRAGCQIDNSNLSKYENGLTQRPTPAARKALLEVLELTPEQLFAPCATCGQDWSTACLEHPASGREPGTGDDAIPTEQIRAQPIPA